MKPTVHMEVTLTRLLKAGGRVVGAFGYDRQAGGFVLFRAKAVVLATGGWGRMFKFTSNSWESTGDGCAMAFEAGAELMDMEMVQFHPTGMLWPPGVRGILVTEAVRGEGGVLRNSKGERFMFNPDYMPVHYRGKFADTEEEGARWLDDKAKYRRPPELLPRDVVSRAIDPCADNALAYRLSMRQRCRTRLYRDLRPVDTHGRARRCVRRERVADEVPACLHRYRVCRGLAYTLPRLRHRQRGTVSQEVRLTRRERRCCSVRVCKVLLVRRIDPGGRQPTLVRGTNHRRRHPSGIST